MLRSASILFLLFCLPAAADDRLLRPESALPGLQADGSVRLPNAWSLKPAGKQINLGDFPVNMALHPSGKWLAVLHAGHGEHEIIIVELDAGKEHIISRVSLEQTFNGIVFAPDGGTVYAGGGEFNLVHAFEFKEGYLTRPRRLPVAGSKFVPGALAIHPQGHTL